MTGRYAPAVCFVALALGAAAPWFVVSALGWVDSLTVITGDGTQADVVRAVVALAAWFAAVLVAPTLGLAALLDLVGPAAWRAMTALAGVKLPEGRRRNQ